MNASALLPTSLVPNCARERNINKRSRTASKLASVQAGYGYANAKQEREERKRAKRAAKLFRKVNSKVS